MKKSLAHRHRIIFGNVILKFLTASFETPQKLSIGGSILNFSKILEKNHVYRLIIDISLKLNKSQIHDNDMNLDLNLAISTVFSNTCCCGLPE